MATIPQPININFARGLDTKTDPKQVQVGSFLSLKNSIFDKGGLLQKRNGFGQLPSLPDASYAYVTALNDNLTAIGPRISALIKGTDQWIPRGTIQPMQVRTLPLIRNNANQTQCDTAVSPNGLVCTVYTETIDGTTFTHKYAVADAVTGQNIIAPTLLPSADPTFGTPRVFILNNYFIIIYTTHPSAYHLQFIAISFNNTSIITIPADIVTAYTPASTVSWDAVVYGQNIYIGFNTTTGGQSVKIVSLSGSLLLTGLSHTFAGSIATMLSMSVDYTNSSVPIIYASWYDSASTNGFVGAVDSTVQLVLVATQDITSVSVGNITSFSQNGSCQTFYEVKNNYGYDSAIPTHYVSSVSVSRVGVVSSPYVVVRSVGLASKAFIVNGIVYFLGAFQSPFQPSYFLINGTTSTSAAPITSGKLAYENGGGYLLSGLPGVTVTDGDIAQFGYLYKDLIEALATMQNSTQTTTGGIYSQTGINLGTFTINNTGIDTAEIAQSLNISGGFLWMYDGYLPVEQNFFLWPDSIEITSTTGGALIPQQYYYQVVYSWTDNSGNIHRSAPSIPVTFTLSSNDSLILNIPTLRLTYKIANPVKIEVYRWSAANQNYYQVSASSTNPNPMEAPLYNDTTVDYVTFTDVWADTSIVGNNLIYTTGGVVEDVNAPASNILTLFDDRLWLVDAEDPNLLWYSKQVIEATPVEMSDLFTFYVAPTSGAQGSTGPITALAPMDDKLIIFKNNAIYYINGTGPDNTGASSGYSQPIFITATVGCADQTSIVFTPNGLMFQSDKGIWLLGRGLETNYIGAPVQDLTLGVNTESAVNVPETNQVRFTMDSGETLMFDYYYSQWGEFEGIPGISSCIYNGLHTFINNRGEVYQETPGIYLDGSNPVLLSFVTGFINLSGINGYQRIFEFIINGNYISPHLLDCKLGYDFGALSENAEITPTNATGVYGSDSLYGQTSPYGGPGSLERWRIQPATQKCSVVQLSIQEIYDPSFGVVAGAGFTMSGITAVLGILRGYRPIKTANAVGTG